MCWRQAVKLLCELKVGGVNVGSRLLSSGTASPRQLALPGFSGHCACPTFDRCRRGGVSSLLRMESSGMHTYLWACASTVALPS
eukprot:13228073-Alexandrium_andersonii.AAC.1